MTPTLAKLLRFDAVLAVLAISGAIGRLYDPIVIGTVLPIVYVAVWFFHERVSHGAKHGAHAHAVKDEPRRASTVRDPECPLPICK